MWGRSVAPDPDLTRFVARGNDFLGQADGDGEAGNAQFADAVTFQPGAGVEVDEAEAEFIDIDRFVALPEPLIHLLSNRARPGGKVGGRDVVQHRW